MLSANASHRNDDLEMFVCVKNEKEADKSIWYFERAKCRVKTLLKRGSALVKTAVAQVSSLSVVVQTHFNRLCEITILVNIDVYAFFDPR